MAFDPLDPRSERERNERLNSLEQNLYSRDAVPITAKQRPDLSPHKPSQTHQGQDKTDQTGQNKDKLVEYGWRDETPMAEELETIQQNEHRTSFVTKIFMASVLFFVVAAAIAAYIILGGYNNISSKNVDIAVRSLVAVSAGEVLPLDITVQNNNNVALDSGTINVEYPSGTRSADDVTKPLIRDQINFNTVPAGGTVTKTVKAVFFGQKDSVQEVKISVQYRAHGSNADFSKEKTYDITINSSPLLMTMDVPQEINSGQNVDLKIHVESNSNATIQDLLVRADYPFGFTFTSAAPAPTFDTNVWNIGDLAPQSKKTIIVHGKMVGQDNEERTFRVTTGTAAANDEKQIAVSYVGIQQSIAIRQPFLGLQLQLNGRTPKADQGQNQGQGIPSVTINAGDAVVANLNWTNNLPVVINDAKIQVKLSGRGYDRNHVSAQSNGFFRSSDNTIIWDKNSVPALASIEPGGSGSVSFSFMALDNSSQLASQGRNMEIDINAAVTGTRIQGDAPQNIESNVAAAAKIGSKLVVDARVLHSSGAFKNAGTLPPKADQTTDYTVVWDLSNAYNDLSNVTLSTKLPPYVTWANKIKPTTEQINYDYSTRTVTWTVPDLRAGVGYNSASREVSFQIHLQPSVSQVGIAPDLTDELNSSGTDRFTGSTVQASRPPLNTRLVSDPAFQNGDERVVR